MKTKQFRKGGKQRTGLTQIIMALAVANGMAVLFCMLLAVLIQKGSVTLTVGGYAVYVIEFFSMLVGCIIAAGTVPGKRGAGIGLLVGVELLILVLLNLGLADMDQSRLPWCMIAVSAAAVPALFMKRRRRSAFRI